ncbi:hypothetical protein ST201phi2-1p264 [Pseudomonas phage 201phi2-1]|uniref:Uncharacterized protein n=1 Tax=Pseudomonas phage 201phi2-1 TaxID=198110 RepID=B3FJC6_BP201|nr:hypothetical protein ST201phi2-1p264 [Pseudomonas phage 201phi2-1]ABY63092.1 hypothetical protein 201phi2-1p264 [Pseudomonas phage 201phi2-1]
MLPRKGEHFLTMEYNMEFFHTLPFVYQSLIVLTLIVGAMKLGVNEMVMWLFSAFGNRGILFGAILLIVLYLAFLCAVVASICYFFYSIW